MWPDCKSTGGDGLHDRRGDESGHRHVWSPDGSERQSLSACLGSSVDGIVGPQTQGALRRALAGETPPEPEVRTNRTQAAEGDDRYSGLAASECSAHEPSGNRSAANYNAVLDQFSVGNNPRYARRNGNTYCNIFVWDATRAMGAEIPHWVDQQGRPAEVGAREALGRWMPTIPIVGSKTRQESRLAQGQCC